MNFSRFGAAKRISRVNVLKWLERDQDNHLHMKFLAWNVDISGPNSDLYSRRSEHAGVKDGYLSKKWLFIRCWLV